MKGEGSKMNLPISRTDFIFTTSEFAEVLTMNKVKIKKLYEALQHYVDDHLKEIINRKIEFIDAEDVESSMEELKKQLINLDFFIRGAVLRIFFHLSNYLYILRPPMKQSYEDRRKIPVHNITFPKKEEKLHKHLPKSFSTKFGKKKELTKIRTCVNK